MKKILIVFILLIASVSFAETEEKPFELKKQPSLKTKKVKDLAPVTKTAAVDWESKLKEEEEPKIKKRVTVFLTPTCSTCDDLKKFLRKHRVTYKTYDISKDFNGQKKYTKLGGSDIPAILVDDKLINGFQPEQLKSALEAE